MDKNLDYGTLSWVKQEIDETLNQARQALEEYVDNPEDGTQLQFCFSYLHQVTGTLQMVELYGAALLAEEMERLAQALLNEEVAQRTEAYEVLMRGILQLPDYLERVQSGFADEPLVLLPLLNDLRAARGENLLSENALFAPDLSGEVTVPDFAERDAADDQALVRLARKLRHQFQIGLLGWIRNQDVQANLAKMAEVVNELEHNGLRQAAVRLWWVTGAVLEALSEDGVDSSVSIKKLLGQVDREIKRLIDVGEQALADDPAGELLKNLLYYVARSVKSTPRVTAVKERFKLGGAVPNAEEIATAREQLAGPNAAMMRTVADAIREDLAGVKDALDLFLRSGSNNVQELAPQMEVLHKVADTLGMLGMGMPRKVIQQQEGVITRILDGELDASEERLMEIAGSLLYAESCLQGLVESRISARRPGNEDEQPSPTPQLPAAELREIGQTVLREVSAGINLAKEAIVAFIDSPWDHELLVEVPQQFAQVRGAIQMLGMDTVGRLLDATSRYIETRLLGERIKPEQYELEALADAISSVEYFLEARLDDRVPAPSLLDVARRSVATLGFPIEDSDPDSEQDLLQHAEQEPEAPREDDTIVMEAPGAPLSAVAEQPAPDFAEPEAADEVVEEIAVVAPADEAAVEIEQVTLEEAASEAEVEDPQPEPEVVAEAPDPQPAPQAAVPVVPAVGDDLDDDILEIFVEEAREELAAINEMLPKWREDRNEHEPLSRMRRSFHTLKGSGRLVGATVIGELSWSIENLLNRILDHTIPAHEQAVTVIGDAADALPQLIDALERHEQPGIEVQPLIDRAFAAVEDGKTMPAVDEQPAQHLVTEALEATAAEEEPEADDGADAMDSQLHEIFSKESATHLQAIHEFMERCRDDEQECAITDGLIRALHTLHGSARMAGAEKIAELAGWLEKYAKALMGNDERLPEDGMSSLVEAVAAVEQILSQLNQPGAEQPDRDELVARLRALYQAEQAKVEERLRREQNAQREADGKAAADAEQAEYDQELVEVFLEEASEILDSSDASMQRWRDEPDNKEIVAALQRDLHTLKGGARMAGIAAIGDLSHGLESLLEAIVDDRAHATAAVQDAVHRALDRLYTMLERTQALRPVEPAADLVAELEALLANGGEPGVDAEDQPTTELAQPVAETPASDQPRPTPAAQEAEVVPFPIPQAAAEVDEAEAETAAAEQNRRSQGQDMVRVRADLLDNLVNYAGEVSIYRSRLEQNVGAFGFNLVELGQTVTRLRDQLRKLEIETEAQILYRYEVEGEDDPDFDPLEMDRYSHMQQLSRALMESVADISSIEGLLDGLVSESETLLLQQSRVNTDLQEKLMRTRMVPFTGLVPRLRRIVRQTAQELGKKAQLQVSGAQGEMDRTVLDRILAPLEHMLRNAVSHGIESPERRLERDKPETGTIHVGMSREGSEVVITVTDDGAGMNLEAIRRKAAERGLLDDSAELTDHDVMQFVLESGFSTASEVTQISGRGVGMDVVNSEIKQLGGSLQIDSRHGHGTRFVIRLPFTLAVNQALLVAAGDETYAVPLTSVEGIVRMSRPQLEGFFEAPTTRYEYGGRDYQVQGLSALLGSQSQLSEGTKLFPVMLVRSGDHRMALQVDALMGSREIVVKSVGPQISTIRSVSGATILGDGRVVLILDVAALIRVSAAVRSSASANEAEMPRASKSDVPTVMVVDDSITVRKVTSRLLQRNGMQVLTAKDGVDAVAQLQENIPDVMLLDIEMPRMDGFELATHIRNEPRLQGIPIIMITSRTGDKHRNRAREIGVDRYLGKPYQEADLLENINDLLGERQGDS